MTSELLALMQAGDLRALDRFARESSHRLLAVARRQCHLAADAEDAVQQALLLATSGMTEVRESPLAWLSTLVARTCQRMNAKASHLEPLEESCTCDDDPSVNAERHQLGERLSAALMTLQRTDRLLFLLSAEGFDGVELAERFGLSHDAVRGRLKRARQKLRDTLEGVAGTAPHDHTRETTRHR
jgi:RNA polymerase sigma-70 factor (ECF subfamily)